MRQKNAVVVAHIAAKVLSKTFVTFYCQTSTTELFLSPSLSLSLSLYLGKSIMQNTKQSFDTLDQQFSTFFCYGTPG